MWDLGSATFNCLMSDLLRYIFLAPLCVIFERIWWYALLEMHCTWDVIYLRCELLEKHPVMRQIEAALELLSSHSVIRFSGLLSQTCSDGSWHFPHLRILLQCWCGHSSDGCSIGAESMFNFILVLSGKDLHAVSSRLFLRCQLFFPSRIEQHAWLKEWGVI